MDCFSGNVLYQNIKCCDDTKSSTVEVEKTYFHGTSSRNNVNKKFGNEKMDAYEKSRTNTANSTSEPYAFQSKCYQYKALLLRIRTLLHEIKAIKNNEPTGMCEFCNRYNSTGKCKRCEMLTNRYGIRSTIERETRHRRYKIWLFKVKQFLYRIIESDVFKHKLYHENFSEPEELRRLLQELKPSLDICEPYIGKFSSIDSLDNVMESKDILEEVLLKLKTENMLSCIFAKDVSHPFSSTGAPLYFKTADPHFLGKSSAIRLPPFPINNVKLTSYSHAVVDDSNYLVKDAVVPSANEAPCPSTCKYFDGKEEEKQFAKLKGINPYTEFSPVQRDIQSFDDRPDNKRFCIKTYEAKRQQLRKNINLIAKQHNDKAPKLRLVSMNNMGVLGSQKNKKINELDGTFGEKQNENKTEKSEISQDLAKPVSETLKQDIQKNNKKQQEKRTFNQKQNGVRKDKRRKSQEFIKSPSIIDKKATAQKDKARKNKDSKDSFEGSFSKSAKSKVDSKTKEINLKNVSNDPKHGTKYNLEDQLMAMLLKSTIKKENKKQNSEIKNKEKPIQLPKIEELPVVARKLKKVVDNIVSESFIDCGLVGEKPMEMIKGTKIIPIEDYEDLETRSIEPILYKIRTDIVSKDHKPSSSRSSSEADTTTKKKAELDQKFGKAIIRYTLSNREYIDKGWTLLPTTKIMRRMNIYKMLPASPKFDWFKRHKAKGVIFYDSGEKMAEIEENENGKWYYRDGNLALDFYSSQENNSRHRYVIYSSGETKVGGKKLPVTILATFDYLGNGVVYDNNGNERLKYNQSEGIVIDEKIGPPGRWKWHTLNEPAVLQPVFVDTYLKNDDCIRNLLQSHNDDENSIDDSRAKKELNLDMLTIELENFMKEKANKLLQEFKPFHIRMKACKINDQFSLKVLDQSNIYLLFRDGKTSIKLNLGMRLVSDEIVDTDVAEVTQVATPYDQYPPKSQSIANIQNVLENARKLGGTSKRRG